MIRYHEQTVLYRCLYVPGKVGHKVKIGGSGKAENHNDQSVCATIQQYGIDPASFDTDAD